MNYLNDARLRGLAERYVLGVMPRRSRRRFSRLLSEHPAAWEAVLSVEIKLQPLIDGLEAETPPERVWERIDASINSDAMARAGQGKSRNWVWAIMAVLFVTSLVSVAGWWLSSRGV